MGQQCHREVGCEPLQRLVQSRLVADVNVEVQTRKAVSLVCVVWPERKSRRLGVMNAVLWRLHQQCRTEDNN